MKTETTIFSAGCFWHVQHDLDMIRGVTRTTAGYIGGDEKKYPNPTYEMLHGDKTGYVEAVELEFDPKVISYQELLEKFWKMHNPIFQNKQGPDVGTQYQAGIFCLNELQKKQAEESKKQIEKNLAPAKVYTFIRKAPRFYRAEEYHQKYYEKTGRDTCPVRF